MNRYKDAKGNEYTVGEVNYLGDRLIRDSNGVTVGALGPVNYLGETPILDVLGKQIGTVGQSNYLGELPIKDSYGKQVGSVGQPLFGSNPINGINFIKH